MSKINIKTILMRESKVLAQLGSCSELKIVRFGRDEASLPYWKKKKKI